MKAEKKGTAAFRQIALAVEARMTDRVSQEARIAELEAQLSELSAHIPRMLSIMLEMQQHLEAQNRQLAQRPRRPAPPAKAPFRLDDGWLVV